MGLSPVLDLPLHLPSTTIASSTTRPMASTIANMVRMLIVNPRALNAPNVPISATGTAAIGMSEARALPRKMNTTKSTRTNDSASVRVTSLSAAVTNVLES